MPDENKFKAPCAAVKTTKKPYTISGGQKSELHEMSKTNARGYILIFMPFPSNTTLYVNALNSKGVESCQDNLVPPFLNNTAATEL